VYFLIYEECRSLELNLSSQRVICGTLIGCDVAKDMVFSTWFPFVQAATVRAAFSSVATCTGSTDTFTSVTTVAIEITIGGTRQVCPDASSPENSLLPNPSALTES